MTTILIVFSGDYIVNIDIRYGFSFNISNFDVTLVISINLLDFLPSFSRFYLGFSVTLSFLSLSKFGTDRRHVWILGT